MERQEISAKRIVIGAVAVALLFLIFSRLPEHVERGILWVGLAVPLTVMVGIVAKIAWEQYTDPTWRKIRALGAEREKRRFRPLKVRAAIVGAFVLVLLTMALSSLPRAEWLSYIVTALIVGVVMWICLWLYTRGVRPAE